MSEKTSDKKRWGSHVGQILSTVVVALVVGGTSPWWWTELFAGSEPPPEPEQRLRFLVSESNPFTGGLERQAEFQHEQRDAYTKACDAYRKVHWVKWRYAGISEPLRTQRFASRPAAQRFVDDKGPAKKGAIPGFAILSEPATLVAAKVTCREIPITIQQRSKS